MDIMKRCGNCGEEKPMTAEYFYPRKDGRDKFRCQCIECHRAQKATRRRDEGMPARVFSIVEGGKRRCTKCGEWKLDTIDYYRKERTQCKKCEVKYRQDTRGQRAIYQVRHYTENRDRILAKARAVYHANPDPTVKRTNEWRRENIDRVRVKRRTLYHNNPHNHQASHQRRRARKLNLPDSWTNTHWLLCLDYWHNTCAVCGGQLRDLFGDIKPNADHWVPLNYRGADNPGTVPGNMICLCSSCNCSKQHKMPERWLTQRYGVRKAKAIMQRIQDYFDWIKSQVV